MRQRRGFTLIEILIAIGIISVLVGIVITSLRASIFESAGIAGGRAFNRSLETAFFQDMKGRWNLTADGTTVVDLSGNNNNGNIVGGAQVIDSEIHGKALSFDGTDDFVEFNKPFFSAPADTFTVSLWAKPFSTPAENKVLFYHSTTGEFLIGYSGTNDPPANQFFFSMKLDNGAWTGIRADTKSLPNKWHHVAVAFDKNDDKAVIYVNGKNEGEISPGRSLFQDPKKGTPSLGAFDRRVAGRGVSNYFYGVIDEVRAYKRVPWD